VGLLSFLVSSYVSLPFRVLDRGSLLIFRAPVVRTLDLNGNRLAGSLPDSLSTLTNLSYVSCVQLRATRV
jgi:hypothetical protein